MTNVAWTVLDFNQGTEGYLDAKEVTEAKKKGVKNVWTNMTEADYNSGITKEQKLSQILLLQDKNALLGEEMRRMNNYWKRTSGEACYCDKDRTLKIEKQSERIKREKAEAKAKAERDKWHEATRNEASERILELNREIESKQQRLKELQAKVDEYNNNYMERLSHTVEWIKSLGEIKNLMSLINELKCRLVNRITDYQHPDMTGYFYEY